MALMRLLKSTDTGKENSFRSLKTFDFEMDNMKQIIKEKNVVIQNNNERIKELENYVSELKEQCTTLQNQMTTVKTDENLKLQETIKKLEQYCQMPDILSKYEHLLREMNTGYEAINKERNATNGHLENVETGFADLITKYERLKCVLKGYQQNQEALLKQIDLYRNAVTDLQERYDSFKKYANDKLTQANTHLQKIDKKHISELAKVKTKVLQSKVKISELEKTISIMSTNPSAGDAGPDIDDKSSVFSPLRTNFSYK